MIYVSSSCVKKNRIEDSVSLLYDHGFNFIELSGGTEFYDHKKLIKNLVQLKKSYNLNYIIHNYFPPPKSPFILNLATNQDEIYQKTHNHLINCINYSNELESDKFGFHAGFFFNIELNEIGKNITAKPYEDFLASYNRFLDRYNLIKKEADIKGVQLFIENNVYSKGNAKKYGFPAPAMLLCNEDFTQLEHNIDFNLLLDIAHLKVSCSSLGLNLKEQLTALYEKSDYIHFSDNDGLSDSNLGLKENSDLYKSLKQIWTPNKTMTIEVYSGIEDIKETYHLLEKLNS